MNNTQCMIICKAINTLCHFQGRVCAGSVAPMSWRKRFTERFYLLKKTEGLTQEALAEKVGVTQGTIGHWLNGRRSPDSLEDYEKLASALGVHPAELLYGVPPGSQISKESAEFALAWEDLPPKERASLKTLVFAFKKPSTKGGNAR